MNKQDWLYLIGKSKIEIFFKNIPTQELLQPKSSFQT